MTFHSPKPKGTTMTENDPRLFRPDEQARTAADQARTEGQETAAQERNRLEEMEAQEARVREAQVMQTEAHAVKIIRQAQAYHAAARAANAAAVALLAFAAARNLRRSR